MCTRGAAGFRAMHIFSSTYFDEIIIFELSKDQTFRIWSTFMNPEQFLILVLYLLLFKFYFRKDVAECNNVIKETGVFQTYSIAFSRFSNFPIAFCNVFSIINLINNNKNLRITNAAKTFNKIFLFQSNRIKIPLRSSENCDKNRNIN